MTWLGGIELIAIALLGIGAIYGAVIVGVQIWANDIVHRHCADPDRGWE